MPIQQTESVVEPRPDYLDQQNPLEGFDWLEVRNRLDRINARLAAKATFLVVFSSEQRADLSDADKTLLHHLDNASHDEALESEALIHYFASPVDELGRAVSWCLWSDRRAAAEALHGESHKQAIALARAGKFYNEYGVRFYSVRPDIHQGYAFTQIDTGHNFDNKKEGKHANI